MIEVRRGELWSANLDPQSYKDEPGKKGRSVLVIQTDSLNSIPFRSTLVVPGTTDIEDGDSRRDSPLLVRVKAQQGLLVDIDLLISQARSISNERLIQRQAVLPLNIVRQVEDKLRRLIAA